VLVGPAQCNTVDEVDRLFGVTHTLVKNRWSNQVLRSVGHRRRTMALKAIASLEGTDTDVELAFEATRKALLNVSS